LILFI
jgi:hypothetical protein